MHSTLLALRLLVALTSRTLTVGPTPTHDFGDLAQAVRASRPGDVLLVTPGVYGPIDVDHALVIASAASDGTRFTVRQEPGRPALTVRGVGTGASVTVRDVQVQQTDAGVPAVALLGCAGGVQLHGVRVDAETTLPPVGGPAAVLASQCRSVWLRDLRAGVAGMPIDTVDATVGCAALVVDQSDVLLQGCALRGFDRLGAGLRAGDALRLHNASRAALQDTLLRGGDGDLGGNGLVLRDAPRSRATLCGAGRQDGGLGAAGNGAAFVPASPLPGACLFEAAGRVETPTRWAPGTAPQVAVESFLPRDAWLLCGAPRLTLAGLPGTSGALALDPASAVLLGHTQLPAGARPRATLTCPVPPGPALVGLTLTVQALLDGVPEAPLPSWSTPTLITVAG